MAHGFGGFDQTAVWESPTTGEQGPVLNDHGEQLGIKFTENAPRVVGVEGIELTVTFPEFEEQFNLPTEAGDDAGFGEG